MKQRIPNLLTYSRIAVIPLFVAAFYMGPAWQWVPLGLFLYASITDFFDGYLARKWDVISDIGRVLDPIADKLLVAVALIMLLVGREFREIETLLLICTLIILSREIFVSGLREALENKQITLHVSKLGKWKTATQMLAITGLLFMSAYGCMNGYPELPLITTHGETIHPYAAHQMICQYTAYGALPSLILAALLTLITGVEYTVKGFRALKKAE